MTDRLPYPPPYMDIDVLCAHVSISPSTVDAWLKSGKLPPPKISDGKRIWKWKEVEQHLDGWSETAQQCGASTAERIRDATRRLAAERR